MIQHVPVDLCVCILPFHNLTFPDKKGPSVSVTTQMLAILTEIRLSQLTAKATTKVDTGGGRLLTPGTLSTSWEIRDEKEDPTSTSININNGSSIAAMVPDEQPSTWILTNVGAPDQMRWMLLRPKGTKDQCTSYLHESRVVCTVNNVL